MRLRNKVKMLSDVETKGCKLAKETHPGQANIVARLHLNIQICPS